MSVFDGPKSSVFYVERMGMTRSPSTPAQPAQDNSNYALGQNDPGAGTTRAGSGLVLSQAASLVVSLWPNNGASITAAGSLVCWVYNKAYGQWARCPDLDIDLSALSASVAAYSSSSLQNVSRLGNQILWLTSGIVTSPGTADILLRIDGFTTTRGQPI